MMPLLQGQVLRSDYINQIIRALQEATSVISGLNVEPTSPPSMNVIVRAGTAVIGGTVVSLASDTQIAISAPDATYPRFDLITLKSNGTIGYYTGTPEAPVAVDTAKPETYVKPKPPATPAGEVALAEVFVPAGATAIDKIIDRRIITNLNASQMTGGVLSLDRIPTIPYTKTDFADQDLKTTSSPVFAGLTVNGNAVVKGSIKTDGFVFLQGLIGTGQTDANGNATITFSTAFPSTPLVFVQAVDPNARGIVIDVVSVSTTGFTVKARKVTGITSDSAGDHYHSFTPSGSIGSAGDHYHSFTPSGSISSAGDHYHSFTPSGSIGSAGGHSHTISAVSNHSHSFSATTGAPSQSALVLYYGFQPCPAGHDDCQLSGWVTLYVAHKDHTHNVSGTTDSAGGHDHGGYTGSVGDHSHSFTGSTGNTSTAGAHTHSFTGSTGNTSTSGSHTHSFTGSTGNTSTAGAHTHSVDAPVLSVNFVWVAIKV